MAAQTRDSDAIIMGAGPAGLALGLAMAQRGMAVAIVDPAEADAVLAPGFDGRASALAATSWQMLVNLGLEETLAPHACPIERVSVCEALKPGLIDFEADAGGEDGPLGVMMPNRDLRAGLFAAAKAQDGLELHLGAKAVEPQIADHAVYAALADGTLLSAPLLVGADGRQSPVRQRAGIAMTQWRYDQTGIVTAIRHADPHENTAFEIFYQTGPLAILPLPDGPDGEHRSSIVWTVPQEQAAGYLALGHRGFAAAIEERMGGFLGPVETLLPRQSWPLGYHAAASLTAPRIALIGDAGHGIHPIAGQGLNLGLRDAAASAEVTAEAVRIGMDPGDIAMLERYEAWRGLDNLGMGVATDWINRLFRIPGRPASAIRRAGMSVVARTGLLKQAFVAEARGSSGELPDLLKPAA